MNTTRSALLDWSQAQSFVAVAESGSLSAAARKLGQSQPTLGRHIRALEEALGVELFTRGPRGLTPSAAGREILPFAQDMARAAAGLRLAAAGQAGTATGTIRITASVIVSHFVLPPIIAEMRRAHPEIQVELVPSDSSENLIFREADIAIRMYRPTQLDIIARHVCDQRTGLYAARDYIARHGQPADLEEALALDFLGYDRNDLDLRVMREMGLEITRDFFAVRCDDQAAHWHLLRAGCGIGAMQRVIADAAPEVVAVLPELDLPPLPYWLAAPEALKNSARMRLVWDFLAARLGALGHQTKASP